MKLVWTDPSIEDLRSIHDYIARDSEYYAADLIERLILAAERLAEFPRLGRVVPETRDVCRISGERVEILTVVHGRRERTARQLPG